MKDGLNIKETRPASFDEYVGQDQAKAILQILCKSALKKGTPIPHVMMSGRSGLGKTTLCRILAAEMGTNLIELVASNLQDPTQLTTQLVSLKERDILFIDEIHRFNRAQQDVLLDDVESGVLIFIGATTENPFFAVNSPLISRSTVFYFESLCEEDIVQLLKRAVADKDRGLGGFGIKAD